MTTITMDGSLLFTAVVIQQQQQPNGNAPGAAAPPTSQPLANSTWWIMSCVFLLVLLMFLGRQHRTLRLRPLMARHPPVKPAGDALHKDNQALIIAGRTVWIGEIAVDDRYLHLISNWHSRIYAGMHSMSIPWGEITITGNGERRNTLDATVGTITINGPEWALSIARTNTTACATS